MNKEKKQHYLSLSFFLQILFIGTFLLFFLILYQFISLQANFIRENSNQQLQGQVSDSIQKQVEAYIGNASNLLQGVVDIVENKNIFPDGFVVEKFLSVLEKIVQSNDKINALYLGQDDGSFYMVKRLDENTVSRRIVKNTGKKIISRWIHHHSLPKKYAVRYKEYEEQPSDSGYDPRKRSWYKLAKSTISWTNPYPFYTDNLLGITGVQHVSNGSLRGTLGVDVSLLFLSEFLKSLSFSQIGSVVITDEDDTLLAISDEKNKEFNKLYKEYPIDDSGTLNASVLNLADVNSSDTMYYFLNTVLREGINKEYVKENILAKLLPLFFKDYKKDEIINSLLLQGLSLGDFSFKGANYLYTRRISNPANEVSWRIYTFTNTLNLNNTAKYVTIIITWMFIVFFVIFSFIAYRSSRLVTNPLAKMSHLMSKLRKLDLQEKFTNTSAIKIKEIQNIGNIYNEVQRSFVSFKKFVPQEIVMKSLNTQQNITAGMKKTNNITMLFSDIKDFTSIAEKYSSEELCKYLEIYLSAMSAAIKNNHGIIDKFIGDAIMGLFGAFDESQNTAEFAMDAALDMQLASIEVNEKIYSMSDEKDLAFFTRIGINTGSVMSGIVGSDVRLNYTVIGDAVNLASRLEAMNKNYGTNIIVSEKTKDLSNEKFIFRYLDNVQVKGKEEFVKIYQLFGRKKEIPSNIQEYLHLYNKAEYLLQEKNIQEAKIILEDIEKKFPNTKDSLFATLKNKSLKS